jgi:hypothetical protein
LDRKSLKTLTRTPDTAEVGLGHDEVGACRAHWGIENKLHWVGDVSMKEDRCRVRAGARALAALRNLVPWLIRSRGLPVPEARQDFREDRAGAAAVVTG